MLLGEGIAQAFESPDDSEVLKRSGVELVSHFTDASRNFFRHVTQLGELRAIQRRTIRRLHRCKLVETNGEQSDLLTDIVMEFAGNAFTLLFLGMNEAAGQVTDAFVVPREFFLIVTQAFFHD